MVFDKLEAIYLFYWSKQFSSPEKVKNALDKWTEAIDRIGYDPTTMKKTLDFIEFGRDDSKIPPTLPEFLKLFTMMRGSSFTIAGEKEVKSEKEKEYGKKMIKMIKDMLGEKRKVYVQD